MPQPLLEGNVDTRDADIERLRGDVERLAREAAAYRQAISALRRQLAPLYGALQSVFGEMDTVIAQADVALDHGVPPKTKAVWESWKRKLGDGKASAFIDAMLEHGEMTAPQLRVAAHCGQRTVYDTIFKLNKLGLVNKNGGKYSLKQL